MKFHFVILVIRIVEVYPIAKIPLPENVGPTALAAANIVEKCFGSTERWSELLVISDNGPVALGMLEKIHSESDTSSSVVSLPERDTGDYANAWKCNDHFNSSIECLEAKPAAVIIETRNLQHLEYQINSQKNDARRVWTPLSYFLIVVEGGCSIDGMFEVVWNHWILNAIILCSLINSTNFNDSEIKLYTFNPYSSDRPPQWKIITNETVEVSITPGNFTHSWYIFERINFTGIKSSGECRDLYFDKTSNLDGYLIPMSFVSQDSLLDSTESEASIVFAADNHMLKILAESFRFDVVQVGNDNSDEPGRLLPNGSYTGVMDDLYKGRSHLAPSMRSIRNIPGLGMTYPHDVYSSCFASRIVGPRPQWMNLADAKHIWIALGLGLIFSTVFFYLHDKSQGFISALLDAERLVIGSSIIRIKTDIKYRIILGSIFLVLIVVDGAIRGRFISILTVVQLYPNLDHLEQLRDARVDIYGHQLFRTTILDPKLSVRFNATSFDLGNCLDSLEHVDNQQACIADCPSLKLLTLRSSIIHVSVTPFFVSHIWYVAAINWPITNRYSSGIHRLKEGGIYAKLQSEEYRKFEVKSWKYKRTAVESYVRPTKLRDLLAAFMLLLVGTSVASIVFVWELAWWKYSRHDHREA